MIPDADIVWDKREQSRIEAQNKKQQELKLIGSILQSNVKMAHGQRMKLPPKQVVH